MDNNRNNAEPLSIWFFVGLILLVYGLLLVLADFLPQPRSTVLADIHPALWWGAITSIAGGVFLAIGLRGRKERSKP
ncbi:MAG: hypothetical protein MUF54_13750 [Polyangiaceae bacterium]|jgi:hypothetical protein|nr:hypothetical protein [Polyangiaceae bacterium]